MTIKMRERDLVTMVDGDDSMWLQDDETNRAIINIMLLARGPPEIESLREVFFKRIVDVRDENGVKYYPKLTQYASKVIRRYVWSLISTTTCSSTRYRCRPTSWGVRRLSGRSSRQAYRRTRLPGRLSYSWETRRSPMKSWTSTSCSASTTPSAMAYRSSARSCTAS